jgi:hypothetical protein
MMNAAIEEAKALEIMKNRNDAGARKGATKFFTQKERVENKTKVESFVAREHIPDFPSSSVTVSMLLEAGNKGYTVHKFINAASIQRPQTRLLSKNSRRSRLDRIYDGVVLEPPSCMHDFGEFHKS